MSARSRKAGSSLGSSYSRLRKAASVTASAGSGRRPEVLARTVRKAGLSRSGVTLTTRPRKRSSSPNAVLPQGGPRRAGRSDDPSR